MARGVLGCLSVPIIDVAPQRWKRHLGLTGVEKDVARTLAIQRFPAAGEQLKRKKDIGRADALLVALWAYETEQAARRRTA